MNASSSIEWTDVTWNPTRGCDKVSPGCANCYAETFAERWRGLKGHSYEHGFDLRLVPDQLVKPLGLALKREKCPTCMGSKSDAVSCLNCGGSGIVKLGRRIFVNSMSDLFHENVPDEYIDKVFAVMAVTQRHTFQVLTKRADRMRRYFEGDRLLAINRVICDANLMGVGEPASFHKWPLPNVWLGVSVENQHFADERIPLLLQTPAAVRFISAEPLLGPVDLQAVPLPGAAEHYYDLRGVAQPISEKETEPDDWKYWTKRQARLDWVIVGGESGAGARPFAHKWGRSIVSQCKAAGVPVFVKQLGSYDFPIYMTDENGVFIGGTADLSGRRSKGNDMTEWPEDLRVREFPKGVSA